MLRNLEVLFHRLGGEDGYLQRIREYDENPKTRRYAANIIPIRENGNFMLCTIILGNTICNTICVITFDLMTRGLVMSVTKRLILINVIPTLFIIFFSEVIPQVLCTKDAYVDRSPNAGRFDAPTATAEVETVNMADVVEKRMNLQVDDVPWTS
ncbi:hypothetical protein COOONC_19873 [Cooperia oncophora]